jgi:hypothetical protein
MSGEKKSMKTAASGVILTILLISSWNQILHFVNSSSTISTVHNNRLAEFHSRERINVADSPDKLNLFAYYYPWYGTPNVSGYWFHWNDAMHNPDNFLDGRRQIAAKHYPSLDVYDSNNETLIKKHVDIARQANIDGFVVSWWGMNSFEDKALSHIKNVCEQNDFKFTVYYETVPYTPPYFLASRAVDDFLYLLNNYANSSSWYRIDSRPVIYVYTRALHQLSPDYGPYWQVNCSDEAGIRRPYWRACEDVRSHGKHGIFIIHPYKEGIGYVQSKLITLPPNDTYSLEVSVSDVRNDCPPYSDVGFRIKIRSQTGDWQTLDELIVNFNDGWVDLSYDISSYAGETVLIRVESFDGGIKKWCSEWAAVDYFFIMNSRGRIMNQNPYLDSEWKLVVDDLDKRGCNPYFIVDFGGYEGRVTEFAEYFLGFMDGIHTYNPCTRFSLSDIDDIYGQASKAAHSKHKTFVATVMPGYDDTEIRSPGYIVDRRNGSCYNSFWSVAKSSLPDAYIITSFNEWHEGTEIEPSLEYSDLYINLTYLNTLELLVHDVAIENISPSKTVVGQGLTTLLNVTAMNHGDCIESFNVTIYANSTLIGIQSFDYLAHGTKTSLQITWNTTGFPLGNYTLKAVAEAVANETIQANNSFIYGIIQISIQGDVNADGIVNIVDISIAARAFGTQLGDPKWNANADVNEDGIINILDIYGIAREYGETTETMEVLS